MASAAKPKLRVIEMEARGPLDLGKLPMTDLGNAERFEARFGEDFRYTVAKGWFGWDGRRWKMLDQEERATPAELLEATFKTVRAIQDEAKAISESGVRNADENPGGEDFWVNTGKKEMLYSEVLAKHGRASESAGRLGCIANLVRRWLTVSVDMFDSEPLALNCLNGTVRLEQRAGQWVAVRAPHERSDLITKLAPVEYRADAAAPIYDDFMAWAQPDPAMVRYLHQWGGYSATGEVGEQMLHLWWGAGANGKSTCIDAWAHALGDYSGTIGIETFLDQGVKKRGDAATPDLARLGGIRLLRASEPEKGARLNAALIKFVTGGEPMAVRALNKGFFDLRPQFKLTISFNPKPSIPDTDEGIWRRVRLIPWEQFRIESERDPKLPEKLRAEASGIFARVVAGALDWLNNGFSTPASVDEATQQYRDDSDPLARFLRRCTASDPSGRVQSSKLYEVFVAWCKAAGEKEWTNKGFSMALIDKGFTKKASAGMQWLGLQLVASVADFVDSAGKVVDQSQFMPIIATPIDGDGVPGWDDFGPLD